MNVKIELTGKPCIQTKIAMNDLRTKIREHYGIDCEVIKLGVFSLDINTSFANAGILLDYLKTWKFPGFGSAIEVKKITTVWKR